MQTLVLIEQLKARIDRIEANFEIVKTSNNSLRGLVNRKIGSVEETTEEHQQPTDIYKAFR